MPHASTYCLSRAEECDDRAAEAATDAEREEWQLMAEDWRIAAVLSFEDAGRGRTIH